MKKAFLVAVLLTAFVGSAYARPFISVGAGFGMYGGTTKRISTAQYGYYDDIVGPGTEFGAPLTISVGYLKEKTFGDGFGVSVFYTKNIVSDATIETADAGFVSDYTYYPVDNVAQITSQQAGIGLIYKPDKTFAVNLGVSTDVGSKVVYPVKNTQVERKLKGVYLPLSVDWGYHFDDFGLYTTLGTSFNIAGDEYINNYWFVGLKIQYLISW